MASDTYTIPDGKVVLQTELNLDSRPYAPVVYLTQYDATIPIISARLFLDDEPYKVPATASVNVRMQKPDGKHIYNPALGTNADRTVVYIAVTSQMTSAYGRGYAIVEIANEAGLIGSARMTLEVDRSPATKEDYQSSDEYKTLQQIIDEVNLAVEEANGNADRAETAAKESETLRNEAQTQAEAAASSAQAAAESKDDATMQAQTATQQATAAESSALEAAKSAETAKEYSGNTPIVKNGNWWIWNAEEQTYQDSGNKAVLNYDKTYPSIDEMEADKDNQPVNTLAIISSDVNTEDNAKLYIHNGTDWEYLADLSGFTGNGIKTWEKTAGTGAAGTFDTYTVTWTDGNTFDYQVYNGANGEGAGDMLASVYDKTGKNEDIFNYVDNAVQKLHQKLTIDSELNAESTNPVQNKVIKSALDSKLDSKYIRVTESNKSVLTSSTGTKFFNVTTNIVTDREAEDLAVIQVDSGIDAFQISASGGHLLVRQNDSGSGSDVVSNWPDTFFTVMNVGDEITITKSGGGIKFKSSSRTGTPIAFYEGGINGSGIVIGDGGRTIIGAGESAQALHTLLGTNKSDVSIEEMHVASDGPAFIHTQCNEIGKRHTFTFQNDGRISGVADPTSDTDVVTKKYLTTEINAANKAYVDGKIQYGTEVPESLDDGCIYLVYE